jgi:hypothetical protein
MYNISYFCKLKENEMGKNRVRDYEWATVECEEGSYDVCMYGV